MLVCSSRKSSSQFYWLVSAAVSVLVLCVCSPAPSSGFRQSGSDARPVVRRLDLPCRFLTSGHVCLFIFWLRWLENSSGYCLNIPPAREEVLEVGKERPRVCWFPVEGDSLTSHVHVYQRLAGSCLASFQPFFFFFFAFLGSLPAVHLFEFADAGAFDRC